MDIDCGYIKYDDFPEEFIKKSFEYIEHTALLERIIVDLVRHKDTKIVNVIWKYPNGDVACGFYSELYGIESIYYTGKDYLDIINQILNK